MSANIYQSILHDLSLLSEYELRKVSFFIKEVTKADGSEQAKEQGVGNSVLAYTNDGALEVAKQKNKVFLQTLSPWPDEEFRGFEEEVNFNRTEASTERNLEW